MRIAFLFSLGGHKELTQNQEIKKTKHTTNQSTAIKRGVKERALCNYAKKNVYDLWRESEILLIFAYTTLF